MKVGVDKINDNGKIRTLAYRDVVYDSKKRANAKLYLPGNFDLVNLYLADKRVVIGWHTGTQWDGKRVKPTDKILAWKKREEHICV